MDTRLYFTPLKAHDEIAHEFANMVREMLQRAAVSYSYTNA